MSGRLKVAAPASRPAEREYIVQTVLGDFLGLAFDLEFDDGRSWRITLPGTSARLEIPDRLLGVEGVEWCQPASLPEEPLPRTPDGLPMLYAVDAAGDLPFDLFGACFYLLTRYEERAASDETLDEHGRFPARASLLSREHLLERPLVDEYLAVLRDAIERRWPGLVGDRDAYELVVTHDVDHPMSSAGEHAALVLRRAGGDLLRRRDPKMMVRRLWSFATGDSARDPHNTFDWIMDQSERLGVRSRFHFMAATRTRFDNGYDVSAPFVVDLLRRVAARGHEIGIHPSYRSSREPGLFATEVARLERAVDAAGVDGWSRFVRQHYLRWRVQDTWSHLAAAGLREDSSVGFADAAGFRCGTGRRFRVFDWKAGRASSLVELPLLVMDVTLTGPRYEGLAWEAAVQRAAGIAAQCRRHRTPFTLLWHNDKVMSSVEQGRYVDMLDAVA